MKERQPGCICELNEQGEPIVANYAECPIHKPDAITPKDTAHKLLMKFLVVPDEAMFSDSHAAWTDKILATRFANECVDEILYVLDTFQTHEYAKVLIPYYTEVKNEISKI
jgi:flagellar motor switch protein FliG